MWLKSSGGKSWMRSMRLPIFVEFYGKIEMGIIGASCGESMGTLS